VVEDDPWLRFLWGWIAGKSHGLRTLAIALLKYGRCRSSSSGRRHGPAPP
jgi:hypothetical protein